MRIEYSSRACAVLYNTLKANNITGKVLIPANICETVPATYMKCGLECFFCDIVRNDWQLDKNAAMKLIKSEEISVLHYNHTYGYISNEDELFLKQVKEQFPNIFIVDDRCLCFPEIDDIRSSADIVLYSTGRLKCVDIGWGGYGILADRLEYSVFSLEYSELDEEKFEQHMKACRAQKGAHVEESIVLSNWLKVDTECMDYFSKISKQKKKIKKHKEQLNEIYHSLPGGMGKNYSQWRYQLLVNDADACRKALFDNGLFCSSHYISLGNGFFQDVETPVCDYLQEHVINLFNDSYYSMEQAAKTVEVLEKIIEIIN